jgi:hypothetical protein
MTKEKPVPSTVLMRYTHEFLFSLNLTLLSALKLSVFYFPYGIQHMINGYLHLHPHSGVGAWTVLLTSALVLALCIFFLLRLLASTSIAEQFLRSIAGIVSLIAMPALWLYYTHLSGQLPGLPDLPRALLLIELVAAIVCATLYLRGKWPVPGWGSIVLLFVHYGFWSWVCFGFIFFLHPDLIFPWRGYVPHWHGGYTSLINVVFSATCPSDKT